MDESSFFMYALSRSASNLGRGDVALERLGGGERSPDAFAINKKFKNWKQEKKTIKDLKKSRENLCSSTTTPRSGCVLFAIT